MENMGVILLSILLIITFFSFWRDKRQFNKFKSFKDTNERQKFFKRWTIEPFLLYGISSLIILSIMGQFNSLYEMPEFLKNYYHSSMSSDVIGKNKFLSAAIKGILISLVPILLIGSTFGTIIREYQNRKSNNNSNIKETNFRNLDPLIPKNYKERIWGAILSINAGFSEEIFFRLMAPILIYNISGSTILAILCSTLWFGLAHFYQGIWGVLITFIVGFVFFGVYIITQNIWITMLVHAVLDINGLVFSSWLKERFAKKEELF